MSKLIYKASDCSDMTKDDLIAWLLSFKIYNPQYTEWSFDDITGGEPGFFEVNDYIEMKSLYEKYIENE